MVDVRAGRPIAYLISFRCYGTWLHGDPRGSVTRRTRGEYGDPTIPPQPNWEEAERQRLVHQPISFSMGARNAVARAVEDVCGFRGWELFAVHAGRNHVHVVVGAEDRPERLMTDFKAYATRSLRAAGLVGARDRIWSRHGSTRYLWTEDELARARHYVTDLQSSHRDR